MKHTITAMAALLCAGAAQADSFHGNVGAVSEHLFRGLAESQGAAVQGEVYYTWDSGYYAGAWMTNVLGGGNKVDSYAGYEGKVGEFLTVGGGAVFRMYSEDRETGFAQDLDYPELFVSAGLGPLSLSLYGADDYYGTGEGSLYITADATLPYSETLSFTFQAGLSSGDGVKALAGEEYTDYSFSVEKKLEGDMTVSFQLSDTDIEPDNGGNALAKDDPKFVVGFRKDFDL